jgi:hypothetical protein
MQVSYKIVRKIEGTLVVQTPTDIIAWAEVNGFTPYYPRPNLRLRPELHLQPSIAGLVGPMYDGVNEAGLPVIRYEDQDSYNTLSV